MKLSELVRDCDVTGTSAFRDVEVTAITADSRAVRPGACFVAVRGRAADGHDFVARAVAAGAVAVIAERVVDASVPTVLVADAGVAAALAARRFHGDPAARVVLAGITGTNGKTSSAFLLRSILEVAYGKCGMIGTIGYGVSGDLAPAGNTTPGPVDLQRIIAGFAAEGCRGVVMEVSSHAIDQGRIAGLEFDVGAFTNLTRDHLDYHATMEGYLAVKERFIRDLAAADRRKAPGAFAYNADDPAVSGVAARFPGRSVSFGLGAGAEVRAERIEASIRRTRFELVAGDARAPVELRLLGMFSIYNALTAAAAAHVLGVDLAAVREGLERVERVPGRFQVVARPHGPTVIVDYAHTPDALEKLLGFCRELAPARVITVFGCGGDRDRGKRPLMGGIAARLSDLVFVTDDNPRTEDPDFIVGEILAGVAGSATPVRVVRDRRAAIREAIGAAGPDDIVVIAGKGHEREQILRGGRVPFDDAREAEDALAETEARHAR